MAALATLSFILRAAFTASLFPGSSCNTNAYRNITESKALDIQWNDHRIRHDNKRKYVSRRRLTGHDSEYLLTREPTRDIRYPREACMSREAPRLRALDRWGSLGADPEPVPPGTPRDHSSRGSKLGRKPEACTPWGRGPENGIRVNSCFNICLVISYRQTNKCTRYVCFAIMVFETLKISFSISIKNEGQNTFDTT